MSDPIPNDTPARRALIDLLHERLGPNSILIRDVMTASDEDAAAALAAWLDEVVPSFSSRPVDAAVLRAASAEIHAILRARGLIVTSRGKLARIVDDSEMERRYQIRREAGEDPDARHDDGGVRNGVIVPEVKP